MQRKCVTFNICDVLRCVRNIGEYRIDGSGTCDSTLSLLSPAFCSFAFLAISALPGQSNTIAIRFSLFMCCCYQNYLWNYMYCY